MFAGQRLRRLTAANLERRVSRRASRFRLTDRHVISAVCSVLAFALMPDARRVAPISVSVQCLRFVVAFSACVLWQRDLYHTTKALLAEYLTSYTNTLQLIDYQHFIQCKMPPNSPTRNLHNPHAATRHKHGRAISRHRGAEKSVAPTDFSTYLWRTTRRIRPNGLRGNGVRCVRCVQECVRYFEIILHS